MKERITCDDFRAALIAGRENALGASGRADLEAHRLACPTCAEEARRDSILCAALSQLPREEPPGVTWADVLAAHRPSRRSARRPVPVRRVALAFAMAAALLVFLVLRPFLGPHPGTKVVQTPSAPGAAVAAEATPYTSAHAMLSASDMTGDPNRAVLLVYGVPPGKDRS